MFKIFIFSVLFLLSGCALNLNKNQSSAILYEYKIDNNEAILLLNEPVEKGIYHPHMFYLTTDSGHLDFFMPHYQGWYYKNLYLSKNLKFNLNEKNKLSNDSFNNYYNYINSLIQVSK